MPPNRKRSAFGGNLLSVPTPLPDDDTAAQEPPQPAADLQPVPTPFDGPVGRAGAAPPRGTGAVGDRLDHRGTGSTPAQRGPLRAPQPRRATPRRCQEARPGSRWRRLAPCTVAAKPSAAAGSATTTSTSPSTTTPGWPTSRRCPTQRDLTCAGFLHRAVEWFRGRGVIVARVLTDNAKVYRIGGCWRAVCIAWGIRRRFTKPGCPWTNGKAERLNRTLLTEFAYARPLAVQHRPARRPGPLGAPLQHSTRPLRPRRPPPDHPPRRLTVNNVSGHALGEASQTAVAAEPTAAPPPADAPPDRSGRDRPPGTVRLSDTAARQLGRLRGRQAGRSLPDLPPLRQRCRPGWPRYQAARLACCIVTALRCCSATSDHLLS